MASFLVPLWTRGEGTTWAEVTCPALSMSLALLSWPRGTFPACPTPLPSQTHSPHPRTHDPWNWTNAQAAGPELGGIHCSFSKSCQFKTKSNLKTSQALGVNGPGASIASHGETISQTLWAAPAGHCWISVCFTDHAGATLSFLLCKDM